MHLSDYAEVVLSTSADDWTAISCWGAGGGPSYLNKLSVWTTGQGEFNNVDIESHGHVASLKRDLSVSFAWGMTQNNDFREEWANGFPDPSASSAFLDFFYNGVLVFRDTYVTVDGGRCSIPLPEIAREGDARILRAPAVEIRFLRLLNSLDGGVDFDRYLGESGIVAVEEPWIR